MKKTLLYLTLLLGFLSNVSATHIVGGELNYKCLGNDLYEVSLTIYRDCYNGNPNAFFDNPASIGIFDNRDSLVRDIGVNGQLLIDFIEDDTIEAGLFGICEVEPPNVCVHTTTYRDTIRLPFLEGGYQLAYQRCCRNRTIQNIINPLQTGATYYNFISEEALTVCNSSAVFNEWPPIYICAGEPIQFDHSATDIDGDFLVYELCTPLTGADQIIPRPQPPNPPPYDDVNWKNPPYDEDDMLGGIPLEIHPETGLLTGTPDQLGQFVVGICVKEYRDGVLISTSRRDFQYNVGFCGETVAAFSSVEVQCGDLNVLFQNQSNNASVYEWLIGDPDNPLFTSDQEQIGVITFPDFGTYDVRLIASNSSGSCKDTLMRTIQLLPKTIVPRIEINQIECGEFAVLKINSTSFDPNGEIVDCSWQTNTGLEFEGVKSITLPVAIDLLIITLEVSSSTGCTASTVHTFTPFYLELDWQDTVVICEGNSVVLNENGDQGLLYRWTPPDGLSATDIANPTATLEASSQDYTVYVNSADRTCPDTLNVHVFVAPPFEFDIVQQGDSCSQNIGLELISDSKISQVAWYDDSALTNLISTDLVFNPPVTESTKYYVRAFDENECEAIDSIEVFSRAISFEIEDYSWLCIGAEFNLSIRPSRVIEGAVYEWSPDSVIVEGQGTEAVLVSASEPTLITVKATNVYGCMFVDTIHTAPREDYAIPLDITANPNPVYPGESAQLQATLNGNYSYNWLRDSTLSDLNIYNPQATTLETRTYYLEIIDRNGCRALDSIVLFVRDFECELPYIFVPNAFSPNGDGKNDVLYVRGNAVDEMEFIVVNRWGEKVFETRTTDIGWDGTQNGKALPPDVFGYYLKLRCFDGRTVVQKGNITLLR